MNKEATAEAPKKKDVKLFIDVAAGALGKVGTDDEKPTSEVLIDYWDEWRAEFEKLSDDDKEEFIEYFEPVQENLCDILFCENNVAKDLYNFMNHRNDEDAKKIEAALWHKFLFMEEGVQY